MMRIDPFSGIGERMVEDDGKLHISRSQDVQAILQRNKDEASFMPSKYGEAAWRKVGSIPFVVAEQWSMECGAGIGTKEFMAYCKRKLLDGDYAALRVKGF
jgi:hypothetical protein